MRTRTTTRTRRRDAERRLVTDHVELTVPARAEYLSLARLHVSAVASMVEMTIEEIEDLNLAVEELCLTLLGDGAPSEGRLVLDATWGDDLVEVTARHVGAGARPPDATSDGLPDSLSQRILDALVDEHGTTVEAGAPVAWLRKRRGQRPARS
jgi:hypothetical protein